MNDQLSEPTPAAAASQPVRVEDQFRARWRSGSPVKVEDFAREGGLDASDQEGWLRLIQTEIECRREAGDTPALEEYLERFAELDPDLLIDLMELPPPPPPMLDTPQLPPRYEVGEQLGQGGIGSVWRVHDRLLDRPLAAKVLLGRFRKDPRANARLKREALLTGSLQHPGIPPVYDRGQLARGSTFFTMKLVEGKTLTARLADRSEEDADPIRVLGIFRQIAQTVAYAHSEGITHRDLKPQNVMVGRFGEVQIMDWGMASRQDTPASDDSREASCRPIEGEPAQGVDTASLATDDSVPDSFRRLTRHGDIVGTPAYMPPEQARGELASISPRSDVFSLGAILFEILTGRRLYDDVAGPELIPAIRECRIADSLDHLESPGIDPELATLCRSCLAANPADRPEDGRFVAAAVGDHLASVAERLKRAEMDRTAAEVRAAEERKRRQTVLRFGAAILAVILLGLAGVSWQWNRAARSATLARVESKRAAAHFDRLLLAVDQMLTRVGSETLDQLPYMKTVRRDLLQDALQFYQQILAQEGDSPDIQFEIAEAHRRMGRIDYLLSEYPRARGHHEAALVILADLEGTLPWETGATAEAENLESLARIENRLDNLPASRDRYLDAVPLRRTLAESGSPRQVIHLADSLRGLGRVQENLEELSVATGTVQEATAQLNELLAVHPDEDEAWLALAACYDVLGSIASAESDLKNALTWLRQAVEILTPRVAGIPGRNEEIKAELSRYLNNLALYQRRSNDLEGAEASHRKAIELRRELVQQFPNTPEYRNLLAGSFINQGVVYKLSDRIDEARASYAEAIGLLSQLTLEFPEVRTYRRSLGITLHNTANYLEVTVRDAEAVDFRRQAIAAFETLAAETPTRPSDLYLVAVARNDLAIQLERRGQMREALEAIAQSIEFWEQLLTAAPERADYRATFATSRGLQGWLLAMGPDLELREPVRALELTEAAVTANPESVNYRAHGAALYRNGRYAEAIPALLEAEPKRSGDTSIGYLLAMACWREGRKEEAEDWFQWAQQQDRDGGRLPDVNLAPIVEESQQLLGSGDAN